MTTLLMLLALTATSHDSLEARRDKKLASPFLKKAPWRTDYDEALRLAKESKKPIFAYFTRSYSP